MESTPQLDPLPVAMPYVTCNVTVNSQVTVNYSRVFGRSLAGESNLHTIQNL
jgi:hypothetical protein